MKCSCGVHIVRDGIKCPQALVLQSQMFASGVGRSRKSQRPATANCSALNETKLNSRRKVLSQ